MAHGASGDCGGRNDAANGGWGHGCARCFFFFLSLLCFFLSFSPPPFSLLCSVFFSFFSFGLPPLFCSFVLPLLLSLSFCSLFPCFYRQKTGERETGWPLCCRPSNTWKALGKWGVLGQRLFDAFQRKKVGENRGKKNLLLPLLRASRGRRRPTVPFKTTPFRALFLMNSV